MPWCLESQHTRKLLKGTIYELVLLWFVFSATSSYASYKTSLLHYHWGVCECNFPCRFHCPSFNKVSIIFAPFYTKVFVVFYTKLLLCWVMTIVKRTIYAEFCCLLFILFFILKLGWGVSISSPYSRVRCIITTRLYLQPLNLLGFFFFWFLLLLAIWFKFINVLGCPLNCLCLGLIYSSLVGLTRITTQSHMRM